MEENKQKLIRIVIFTSMLKPNNNVGRKCIVKKHLTLLPIYAMESKNAKKTSQDEREKPLIDLIFTF